MSTPPSSLSLTRLNRIREQGYFKYSDSELSALAFGNRFAYIICTSIIIYGIATANITVLGVMMTIAFLGIVLPNHPFDYLYNYGIRGMLHKPKLPPRSRQLKFACTIATLWLAGTFTLFFTGNTTAGYVLGSSLLIVPILVSSIDLCIPSKIYNALFNIKQ